MRSRRMRLFLFVLGVLLLCGFASSQALALGSPEHSDNHSEHCCAACHLGHSVVLQVSLPIAAVGPSAIACWARPAPAIANPRAANIVYDSTRAPPLA